MEKNNKDINYYRDIGIHRCQTRGSEHYSKIREQNGIDAIEIAILNGIFEDFAITNIVKYALRFKQDRELNDLKKIADYAHILYGVEYEKKMKLKEDEEIEAAGNI